MAKRVRSFSEAESLQDLLGTRVGRTSAWLLTAPFLLVLFAVPLLQLFGPGTKDAAATAPAVRTSRPGGTLVSRLLAKIPTADALRAFESRLENGSRLRVAVQREAQTLLTGVFRAGNSKVVVGADGWLYYQPGLDFVAGPAITDPDALRRRRKKMVDRQLETEPSPDPRPALFRLHADLAARGIRLVVFPVPDKVSMEPQRLGKRFAAAGAAFRPSNRGSASFLDDLRSEGIEVFTLDAASVGEPGERYLRADTHWTPRLMERAARDLAALLRADGSLSPPIAPSPWQVREERRTGDGDLLGMLRLPKDQEVFAPQSVVARAVTNAADGSLWAPSSGSEVLLLGDSFTNVYSDPSLGWGSGAGFAEHLSLSLGLPIDVAAINGGAAAGTRAELAGPGGRERLENARVVVYEFADRDLTTENWKVLPLPSAPKKARPAASPTAPPPQAGPLPIDAPAATSTPEGRPLPEPTPATSPRPTPAPAEPVVLHAKVLQVSPVPEPYSAPYADCLSTVRLEVLRVESGVFSDTHAIAVFLAMKDNEWLPPARFEPGTLVKVRLVPFKAAPATVRSIRRVDDLDDFERIPHYVLEWEIR
ncbi:MAG: alginate O-acetyltransferase AlgX-related protein [Thermoanaerobaculia bacterium]